MSGSQVLVNSTQSPNKYNSLFAWPSYCKVRCFIFFCFIDPRLLIVLCATRSRIRCLMFNFTNELDVRILFLPDWNKNINSLQTFIGNRWTMKQFIPNEQWQRNSMDVFVGQEKNCTQMFKPNTIISDAHTHTETDRHKHRN